MLAARGGDLSTSAAAEAHDSIGVLSPSPVSQEAKATAAGLLSNRGRRPTTAGDPTVLRQGTTIITRNEFKSLRPGGWLYDSVINAYCALVITPQTHKVRCMSTHFLPQLMEPTETEETMLRWETSATLKMHELQHVFIPVNSNNTHWYFIHANVTHRTITVHDSLPVQAAARQQLEAVKRYLETSEAAHTPPGRRTQDTSWTLVDNNGASPRQTNGCDCGVFVMVSIALLAQGGRLHRSTYTQSTLGRRNIRGRIAQQLVHAMAAQAHDQQGHQDTARRQRPPAPTTRKRKQQRDRSIALGGIRLRRRITTRDPEGRPGQRPLVNKKRDAASVAAQCAALPKTTQQHRPRKRRMTDYLQGAETSLQNTKM